MSLSKVIEVARGELGQTENPAGSNFTAYNQAVRTIVETYEDTYPVFCIDLDAHKDFFENASFTEDAVHGHYTALGYEQMAEIYAYILSDYINTHVSAFQDVYKIPYDSN